MKAWQELKPELFRKPPYYLTGCDSQGVPQDDAVAMKWYRLAADQGFASAQFNLGGMYGNGQGVPQDYVTAHMWANIARSKGDGDSGNSRDAIAKSMTPEQIAEAQRRASVCVKSNYKDCD